MCIHTYLYISMYVYKVLWKYLYISIQKYIFLFTKHFICIFSFCPHTCLCIFIECLILSNESKTLKTCETAWQKYDAFKKPGSLLRRWALWTRAGAPVPPVWLPDFHEVRAVGVRWGCPRVIVLWILIVCSFNCAVNIYGLDTELGSDDTDSVLRPLTVRAQSRLVGEVAIVY